MSYNDIDGEQEAERPVVFRGKGNDNLFIATIIIMFSAIVCSTCIGFSMLKWQQYDYALTALSLQAEQTGISAARDTQRIEALLTKQDELIRYRNADIYDDITRIENKRPYADSMLPTATQDCGGDCHE